VTVRSVQPYNHYYLGRKAADLVRLWLRVANLKILN